MLFSTGTAAGTAKIFPFESEKYVLDNGLTVFIIPTPAEGIVSYYSVVRTGSRDEFEKGHSGFAHFFEHMMFRGTKKYPGHVYDSITVAMGANANAYTTDDYTCFHITGTKDNLEKVIELESDRFQNLSYSEDAFKTESGAVYGEYRKGKTNPFFLAYEKLMNTAFSRHTYKHTVIGFEADIAAMPTMYNYSINFLKRYYRPENVIIIVTGDVEYASVKKMIDKYYSNWEKGYVSPKIPVEPEQTAERTATVHYPGKTLPILAIAYKSLSYAPASVDYIASYIVGDLLFGETSDIYKKLVLKEQKVQVIETEFSKNRDPNLNSIYIMLNSKDDIDYVKTEINKVIEKYQKETIDGKKLEDLKKNLKYSFLMSLDTPEKVAGALAREVAITGTIHTIDSAFETLEKVKPEDIKNVLNKYFTPERRTTITLLGGK
jgi:zinc protease